MKNLGYSKSTIEAIISSWWEISSRNIFISVKIQNWTKQILLHPTSKKIEFQIAVILSYIENMQLYRAKIAQILYKEKVSISIASIVLIESKIFFVVYIHLIAVSIVLIDKLEM